MATASLNDLPDEIIKRILEHLTEDPRSFIKFTSCQRRFINIAKELVFSDYWIRNRPIKIHCNYVTGGHLLMLPTSDKPIESFKCRMYSSIRIVKSSLVDNDANLNSLSEVALVELELYECDLNCLFVDKVIKHLVNLKYLTITKSDFVRSNQILELDDKRNKSCKSLNCQACRIRDHKKPARSLDYLGLENMKNFITDEDFTYFIDNVPAKSLNLTGTRVIFHERVIKRYYPSYTSNNLPPRPSNQILSFPLVRQYLTRHKDLVRHLDLSQTDVTYREIIQILRMEELNELKLTVLCCQYISADGFELLDHSSRVKFC